MIDLGTLLGEYLRWRDEKYATHSKRDKAAVDLAEYVITNKDGIWGDLIDAASLYIIALQRQVDLLHAGEQAHLQAMERIGLENDLHEYRIGMLEAQIRTLGAEPYREPGWGEGYTRQEKQPEQQ